MSAPECKNCVCAVTKIGYRCDASVPSGGGWAPGTACPFLAINALEAELAKKDDFSPTPEQVNALPPRLREYIHGLEARCDPSGDVRENIIARDTCRALELELAAKDAEIEKLRAGYTLEEPAVWEWVDRACARSLSPGGYDLWEQVYDRLKLSRADLKGGEDCAVTATPEDEPSWITDGSGPLRETPEAEVCEQCTVLKTDSDYWRRRYEVLRDSFVAQGAVVKRAYTVEGEMASEAFNTMINKFRELLQKADATVAELKSRLLAEAKVCEWKHLWDDVPVSHYSVACGRGAAIPILLMRTFTHCPYCGKPITIKSGEEHEAEI
jgi:hypothetical protein